MYIRMCVCVCVSVRVRVYARVFLYWQHVYLRSYITINDKELHVFIISSSIPFFFFFCLKNLSHIKTTTPPPPAPATTAKKSFKWLYVLMNEWMNWKLINRWKKCFSIREFSLISQIDIKFKWSVKNRRGKKERKDSYN